MKTDSSVVMMLHTMTSQIFQGGQKGTITPRTEATVRHFHEKRRAVWEYGVLVAGRLTWSLEQTYTAQKNSNMNRSITFSSSTKYRDPQVEPSSRVQHDSAFNLIRRISIPHEMIRRLRRSHCSHVHIKLFIETFDILVAMICF